MRKATYDGQADWYDQVQARVDDTHGTPSVLVFAEPHAPRCADRSDLVGSSPDEAERRSLEFDLGGPTGPSDLSSMASLGIGERADRQLSLLAGAVAQLSAVEVPVWLSGGWAVDFVVRRVTRGHDDIDLVIFRSDHRTARRALTSDGYEAVPTSHAEEHQHFVKDAERLSLTFVEYNDRGKLITPGRWADWPYPDGALDAPLATLAGVSCRVLSVPAQLETKLNFAGHPHGAPRRAKDLLDIDRLRDLLRRTTDPL